MKRLQCSAILPYIRFMVFLYNFFIRLYWLAAKVLSINNAKAKLWVDGRKNILNQIEVALQANTSKVVWMHCASLGEFEQGRPIIEELKKLNPQYKILITFFSPSGYEVQKNYAQANWIFYLPLDTKSNAIWFYNVVQPAIAIFVKYEFWYHYYTQAKRLNIPLILVSGIIRKSQPFFKFYGSLHRQMLHCIAHFFLQNQQSFQLLKSIHNTNNISVSGDTRFDRVGVISKEPFHNKTIEDFIGNSKVVVAGSTWTEDDEELDHFANQNQHIKFIVAPHDITVDRLNECKTLYKNSVLYSEINKTNCLNKNVLIIDNVGMLSSLYRYAHIAYVGGGFGANGVHNVLEAAVYHKPVVFGSEYEKYAEAIDLIDREGAFAIDNALELEQTLNELLTNKIIYEQASHNAGSYVATNMGATKIIVTYIVALLK